MVSPGSPARSSVGQRLHAALRSNVSWRFLGVFVFVTFFWLSRQERSISQKVSVVDDEHYLFANHNPAQRCVDNDDPEEWKQSVQKVKCQCNDPHGANNRPNLPAWDLQHERIVQEASRAAQASLHDDDSHLDLVMVGDSLIERWNGTRSMGRESLPEMNTVFDQFFVRVGQTRDDDSRIRTLTLGSSGDTSTNLMWHMEHGLLPQTPGVALQPAVWFIMIGTNDLGRTGCSKRTTLSGILNVAQVIHDRQGDGVPIILHGLLPRTDGSSSSSSDSLPLGRLWQNIMWINRELKRFCSLHDEWIYMDASRLFLQKQQSSRDGTDTEGALEINKALMPEGLHPNAQGYKAWGEEISKVVKQQLAKQRR